MRSAIVLTLAALVACAAAAEEKKIFCYFGSWAIYRSGKGLMEVSQIDPSLCTHLVYTFVGLDKQDRSSIRILDPNADLPNSVPGGNRDGFNKFNQLRSQSPNTKTLVAIGGWNEGSATYSAMVSDPKLRTAFVKNAVSFVRKYGFDGLDFDWEYPNQRGGVFDDKKNFVLLLKELREKFDEAGIILSAAVGAAESSASSSYIVPEVVKYLHFVNLMAYDLHGIWDKQTGIVAPLYPGSWETETQSRLLNVNATINYWLSQGATREKLILGVPFYGRSFTLDDESQKGIGAPASSPGAAGPYTREAGTLGYNEICEAQLSGGWEVHYENEQRVPYAVKGNQWVGYENPSSVEEKAEFVNRLGLGGAMAWSIETDDFRGICGPKYPLLKALNRVLHGDPAHEVKCTSAGFVRDPQDCSVYYVCVPNVQVGFDKHKHSCTNGLVFDTKLKGCNLPQLVNCLSST